jgi:hypothetical protein
MGGATKEELEALEVEIQNQDTQIILIERGVIAVMTAAVYCSYRLGWESASHPYCSNKPHYRL